MKKFLYVFGALIIAGAIWVALNYKHVKAFPQIISAFYAKEYCSCYFVSGNEEKYCHDFARQWVPISDFQLDTSAKSVQVSGLGVTTKAQYLGQRFGCQLQ